MGDEEFAAADGELVQSNLNAKDAKDPAKVAEKFLCVPLRSPLRPLRFKPTFHRYQPDGITKTTTREISFQT